jgi:hypothetical protein
MCRLSTRILIVVAMATLGIGCTTSLRVQVTGDATVTPKVVAYLETQPVVTDSQTNKRFRLQVVDPQPGMGYKTLQVMVDESDNYRILVIDPDSGVVSQGLANGLMGPLTKSIGRPAFDVAPSWLYMGVPAISSLGRPY